MSQTTVCKPFQILGGLDPQTLDISSVFNSTWGDFTDVDVFYTINNETRVYTQINTFIKANII